jgi:MoaA/NifB/PqqE/SkfB family radical SAM enzyme
MKRADASEEIDRFEVIDRIGAYKPRILNISGGEPMLVKELPELLSKAKKTWDPYIRIVHNGTAPGKFESSFPYIDRLVISIDGPGEINTATRGLGGDAVLEKIANLFDTRPANSPPLPEITVNTVVTEKNIDTLPSFAAQIASVSPLVNLALLPVMPVEDELSILKDREKGYRRFLDIYAKMKAVHPLTAHNFDCVMRHDDLRKIQCYNQYFTIRFSPRGELFTCGASLSSQFRRSDNVVGKIFKKGGIKKAFTMMMKTVKGKMGKIDFTCRNMCNCESWLDMLFLGMNTGYAPIILRGFKGRFDDDDYQKLDQFVRSKINPNFDINWFKGLVETN